MRDEEGQSLLHRLGAAFPQEAWPSDLALTPPIHRRLRRRCAAHLDHEPVFQPELFADHVRKPLAALGALRTGVLAAARLVADHSCGKRLAGLPLVHPTGQALVGEKLDVESVEGEVPNAKLTLDVRQARLRTGPKPPIHPRPLDDLLGRERLARAHLRTENVVVVGQAGVRQVLLMVPQRPSVLVPHERTVEPGVGFLAQEEGKLEAVALAVLHGPHLLRVFLLVAVPLRPPHRLDLVLQAVRALDEEDATILVLQGGRDQDRRPGGSRCSQLGLDQGHQTSPLSIRLAILRMTVASITACLAELTLFGLIWRAPSSNVTDARRRKAATSRLRSAATSPCSEANGACKRASLSYAAMLHFINRTKWLSIS